ncbi:MAG: acyl-CoA dehydrogenase [Methylococcaceae bacterium]
MIEILALLFTCGVLAYHRVPSRIAACLMGVWLIVSWLAQGFNLTIPVLIILLTPIILISFPWLRLKFISKPAFNFMQRSLPPMSQTEQEALEAGSTWWDAEIFSGQPQWSKLLEQPLPDLSSEERAFIDGPVENLCAMLDDWDITHNKHDLPPKVWQFIKEHKFFGLIIPKHYGGLEFSNFAHSEIVMKISSRSVTAAVTVMVPNSLGPAKLLLDYGTETQKTHYLPKLATGEEVPCFALTAPNAGSDAGAMTDNGVLCRQPFEGKEKVLGIRLNWEKRYITLGPVATVLGLAFKLYDPEHLLDEQEYLGITLALIPTTTPGVSIGNRHYPLDSAFQNGPNRGKDVFIPVDWIIGGIEQAGNGWRMLMECLSEGRSISLPALSTGAGKYTCRNSGAYARVRKQFNLPISEFEGIEELLARMAGQTYIMDAARQITASALDSGEKPSVISAIIKYELTERMRRVVNDGMDILGGAGICMGPTNFLGRVYQVIPVSITVEGANILTRSMMIFGQGAIRSHPYIYQEIQALRMPDNKAALKAFDKVLLKHLGHMTHTVPKTLWLGLTNAHFSVCPDSSHTQRYYQGINRLSCSFALLTDYALLSLGGKLKRKERLSGNFADVLSNLYLCSAVIKHFQNQGKQPEDLPLMHWACQHTLYRAQQSLYKIFVQLPFKPIAQMLKILIFPLGKKYSPPGEELVCNTAQCLLSDNPTRDRLTNGIYINQLEDDPTGRIERALLAVLKAAPAEAKMKKAIKTKQLPKEPIRKLIQTALEKSIITQVEADELSHADLARDQAISVDEFVPGSL